MEFDSDKVVNVEGLSPKSVVSTTDVFLEHLGNFQSSYFSESLLNLAN